MADAILRGMRRPQLDDATFEVAGYEFGFADRVTISNGTAVGYSVAEFGPFGTYRIPLTADVAWAVLIGFLIGCTAIVLLLGRRRKKRFAT